MPSRIPKKRAPPVTQVQWKKRAEELNVLYTHPRDLHTIASASKATETQILALRVTWPDRKDYTDCPDIFESPATSNQELMTTWQLLGVAKNLPNKNLSSTIPVTSNWEALQPFWMRLER
ncbi:hypothetical protein N7541_005180 [Penicillium brevicompactum]|uniref:Uncharacterized protein n=1 Tax=Penicillium brevicompactum TaxID=5074 RepID=A0A9W9RDJ1_PENBR|nr:hypothetical protein N7541_005180 [Penicillium brevicompactum]